MKRRCEDCGRPLANMNKKTKCFACQPYEIPQYAEYGTMGSWSNRAEYMKNWRTRRREAALCL
jgi:hypothetical protein